MKRLLPPLNPSLPLPCPPRLALVQELSGIFEGLVGALAAKDLKALADQALRFAYYW